MDRDAERMGEVVDFLKSESTLALATQDRDGSACVAPLFYLPREDARLFWFSSPDSLHSQNLLRNPRVAATVHRHTGEWKEIRGVQVRGLASPASDLALLQTIAEEYAERFHLGAQFAPVIAKSTLYCLQPQWVRLVDNSRGFGHQFELSLSGEFAIEH